MAADNMMPSIEELFKYYIDTKDEDFIKETIKLLLNRLIEAEVALKIGAGKYQRSDNRNNYLNVTRQT